VVSPRCVRGEPWRCQCCCWPLGAGSARRAISAPRIALVVPEQVCQLLADAVGQRALDGLRCFAEATVERLLMAATRTASLSAFERNITGDLAVRRKPVGLNRLMNCLGWREPPNLKLNYWVRTTL
jgi:hypothetical protein